MCRPQKTLKKTRTKLYNTLASHKSNPLSVPRGNTELYSTLGQVGSGNSCGGYSLMEVAMTHAG